MTLHKLIDSLGPVEQRVLQYIAERLLHGQGLYGVLEPDDARDWMREAAEELADATVYLALAVIGREA